MGGRGARLSSLGVSEQNKAKLKVSKSKPFIANKKVSEFLLKPGAKHADDFFRVGYTVNDEELLKNDITEGFSSNLKENVKVVKERKRIKFQVAMNLGKSVKKQFITGWQIDENATDAKFITAHRYTDKKGGV